ncbi:MAG: hypothetical protein AB7F66_04665 [Bacteriovoracia bacterium]
MLGLIGTLAILGGAALLFFSAILLLFKRESRYPKRLALLGFVTLLAGAISVGLEKDTRQPKALSIEEWKQHREYIESFSKRVFVSLTAHEMYEKANEYLSDPYIKSCRYGGCAEFRQMLREIMDATEDGRISPKEVGANKGLGKFVKDALDKGEKDINKSIKPAPRPDGK